MPTNADLLKARFCKQYIPRLKEFLTDFDISERIIDGKRNTRDSLGMRFLLAKYDEMKNTKLIKTLKENCHWQINNVTDEELLKAIEEFFHITNSQSRNDDINSISGHRNTLLFNLFKLGISVDDQQNIDDTTIFRIANYFGIKQNIQELGKLYEPFEGFAYALAKDEPEEIGIYQFHNALRLFSCVRNGVIHPDYKYRGDELNHYHEFIIFTYIGYVLACRRIWQHFKFDSVETRIVSYKKEDKKLVRIETPTTIKAPENVDDLKSFSLPEEKVEIIIEQGNHKLTNVKCNGNDATLEHDNLYSIITCKYKPFKIEIQYDNIKTYDYNGLLDCYSWFNCYNIVLPDDVTHSSSDYKVFSEGVRELIENVSESVNNSVREETKKAIQLELAALQPLVQFAKDNPTPNIELEESIKKVLGQLASISKMPGDAKNQIEEVHLQIGNMHQLFLGKLDEFSDSLYDLKERNIIIGEKVDTLLEFTKRHWKRVRVIFTWILSIIGIAVFFYCLLSNDGINWIQYPLISSIIFVLSSLLIISPLLLCKSTHSHISKIWSKFGNGLFTKALISIVIGLILITSVYCYISCHRNTFVKDYEFAINNSEINQRVAGLMKSILESNPDDEDIRIQLSKYYLNYAGDAEEALLIASPMLDDTTKYKKGILAVAEALYSQGKDFWKVRDLIEDYKKTTNCDTNVVNRINGIMAIWGQGRTSNISEGNRLLKLSADNGDADAQYYLGYSYSHEMTDWEKSKETGKIEVSEYNLIDAVEYLRKAAITKPKAALELGLLYADLNVMDSAVCYIKNALNHSNGNLYKESLYRLGLLFEGTDSGMHYMKKAAFLDYEPAILYKAYKAEDHKSAIELYSRPGGYQGYRYILPIVFEYLAIGQKDKALKALQEGRPSGGFDQNFIMGMEAMLGSKLVKRDSIEGMNYMKTSADQGCLYAEMICIFREAEKTQIKREQISRMEEIGKEIPFAFVLLSYIAHKEKAFMRFGLPFADYYANQAIGRGNLAGKLFLVSPPYYVDFIRNTLFLTDRPEFAAYHSNIRERALRMKKDVHLNIFYGYQADVISTKLNPNFTDSIEKIHIRFWDDVSKANGVNLNELYHNYNSTVISKISNESLLNEFSDKIIDKQSNNPFN